MKKWICRWVSVLLIFVSIITVTLSAGCAENNDDTIEITDMSGTVVEIPRSPKKIAAVSPSTGDLMIAFGLGELLDGTYFSTLDNPWATEIYPEAKNFYGYDYDNSVETFIMRGVDLIFIPEPATAQMLREHGLNALCVRQFAEDGYDDYVFYFSEMIRQIWGGDKAVSEKIDMWQSDFTTALNTVKQTLDAHPEIQTQTLYYINGEKDRGLGYTDLGKSLLETVYKALKIDFICNRFESNRPSVEAVLEIDPDIISIGGIYQKKRLNELYSTEPWNQIKAVRENKVYNIPVGFVGFEQTCSASALFIYSQANQIYPDLFDFDLVALTQECLQKYFDYTLTDNAAQNLLDGYFKDGSFMIE